MGGLVSRRSAGGAKRPAPAMFGRAFMRAYADTAVQGNAGTSSLKQTSDDIELRPAAPVASKIDQVAKKSD
jgi:hypothetical protein